MKKSVFSGNLPETPRPGVIAAVIASLVEETFSSINDGEIRFSTEGVDESIFNEIEDYVNGDEVLSFQSKSLEAYHEQNSK